MTLSLSGFKKPQLIIKSVEVDDKRDGETIPLTATNISASSTFSIPQKCPHNGWKPETMQAPVLLSFAIASLLIAALLEVLAQKAASEGGALSIVDTADDIPPIVTFGYLYLPTIVAVIYSLAWNWIDLDVKRMQPWLELSKPGGATGNMSLFLDYPVDFVAFVPFKAARRRHWAVFYSGTIMVVIFWVLTPMQGAVFGTGPVLTRREVEMRYPLALVDSEKQAEMLDQAVLNAGYAVTWLGQAYPPFTTDEYALLPFEPPKFKDAAPANWTGKTVKYWTDLNCWPAEITPVPAMGPGTAGFFDGKGCNVSQIAANPAIPQTNPYKMYYIGYPISAWAEYSLSSPTCGSSAENEFLATWSAFRNSTETVEMSAAFCETKYFKQNVTATVSAKTQRPIDSSIQPLSEPESLQTSEFNRSAFQFLLGAGVSPVDKPRDFPFTRLLEHFSRLESVGLGYPLSPMIGFAFGGKNTSVEEFSDTTQLGEAFRGAHRFLFATAFRHLLIGSPVESRVSGQAYFTKYGVLVSRLFSAMVEGFLCLVAFVTFALLYTCNKSHALLPDDPSPLGSLVKLVQNSSDVLDAFSGKGLLTEDELQSKLGHLQFQLQCGCQSKDGRASISMIEGNKCSVLKAGKDSWSTQNDFAQAGYFSPVKPLALRRDLGALFLFSIAAAIGVLSYLRAIEQNLGGLSLPSSSLEVNLLLTSYIPTAFSTLIEPIWVLLNRLLCILQPIYDLAEAQRSAKSTMESRYTALPPQLAFWRAIKSRHFLLAAVCITALLGNVLAVGLGAVFNELPKKMTREQSFISWRSPVIDPRGLSRFVNTITSGLPSHYDDPYYVVMANLSYGTTFPPWMTSEFSFLPVNSSLISPDFSADDPENELFTTETVGFGVNPKCVSLGTLVSADLPPQLRVSLDGTNGTANRCPVTLTPESLLLNTTMHGLSQGTSAAEIVDTLSNPFDAINCDETLILGWSRANITKRSGTMRSSFVSCSPILRSATFRISFDRSGYIKSASPITDFNSTWPYRNSSLPRPPILSELHFSVRDRNLPWHNITLSYDWLNYLLKLHTKSNALLDPTAPTPDPKEMLPHVEAVYKMVFASYLTLNPYIFPEEKSNVTHVGSRVVEERKIFMSLAAFIVSITILGLYSAMVVLYYGVGVKHFLPRMPSTIGSLLAYIAPSSIIQDSAGDDARRLIFGRFVGQDGRAQIGIEHADRAVPLDIPRLKRGDTRPRKWALLRLGRENRGNTWL